jgi:uncharacterized membrane protein
MSRTDIEAEMPITPSGAPATDPGYRLPTIRKVGAEAPWRWLEAGFKDIMAARKVALAYGLGFFGISVAITVGLWMIGWQALTPVFAGGFLLVGPMLAVGLYETSRRIEAGKPMVLKDILLVKTASPIQLAYLGFLLMFAFGVWLRVAQLLFAMFMSGSYPTIADFAQFILTTPQGLSLVVLGTLIGFAIALTVYAMTAVAAPFLMDRKSDFFTAIAMSISAVRQNFAAMMIWAWIIAGMIFLSAATFFIAMIVVFPLVGCASWHAYRDLVEDEA